MDLNWCQTNDDCIFRGYFSCEKVYPCAGFNPCVRNRKESLRCQQEKQLLEKELFQLRLKHLQKGLGTLTSGRKTQVTRVGCWSVGVTRKKIGGLYLQDRIVEKNCPGLKFEGQLKRGGTSFFCSDGTNYRGSA